MANPTKIVNAPINYVKHVTESNNDPGIKHGRANITHISDCGLFLKATSSLVGFGSEVGLLYPDRRNDHELELAVVIGKQGRNISQADARKHVLGYSPGLDMTTRGKELLSWRKSADTYAVLGPGSPPPMRWPIRTRSIWCSRSMVKCDSRPTPAIWSTTSTS